MDLKHIIALLLLYLSTLTTLAQDTSNYHQHKLGFNIGVGTNNGLGFTSIDIDRDYEVLLLQLEHNYRLLKYKRFSLEVLSQPQFNLSRFKKEDTTSYSNSYEFGINVALSFKLNIYRDILSFYGLIGSGPHYIANTPRRQSDGFIFSDNFFTGLSYQYNKGHFLELRAGKRHASNLNFQDRNGGINTFVISLGWNKLIFRSKKSLLNPN